jgi:hypothetical protein
MAVHHIDPLHTTAHDPANYPDDLLSTLCIVCHAKTDDQDGDVKWPINGRGDEARLDRLQNPEDKQTSLDDFR